MGTKFDSRSLFLQRKFIVGMIESYKFCGWLTAKMMLRRGLVAMTLRSDELYECLKVTKNLFMSLVIIEIKILATKIQ